MNQINQINEINQTNQTNRTNETNQINQMTRQTRKLPNSRPDPEGMPPALEGGAEAFLTNDRKLKQIQELKIICLKDYV